MPGASAEELLAALRWHVDMGVDLAIGDAARDHFAEARARAERAAAAPPVPVEPVASAEPAPRAGRVAPRLTPDPLPVRAASPQGAVSPDEALAEARALAAAAPDIRALASSLAAFDGCALKRSATHLVFAQPAPGARIAFVGGAPDAAEDRSGEILAGAAGALFDAMLRSIGLDRSRAHILNFVPWRPAGGKPPTPPEIAICEPFALRFLQLARPEVVVTLGELPTRALLGAKEPVVRARGKWFDLNLPGSQTAAGLAMLHPDYLVKAPAAKKHAWADLRALRKALADRGLG
jgi:DNA polymerase